VDITAPVEARVPNSSLHHRPDHSASAAQASARLATPPTPPAVSGLLGWDAGHVQVTTLTTLGEIGLLRGVQDALEGVDEALVCVAFVQKAGVHLVRRQLEPLGMRARLLHTTTFAECSSALGMAHGMGAQVGILTGREGPTTRRSISLAEATSIGSSSARRT
jgi:hypothetical protein